MAEQRRATRRLHLITTPKRPDVFMGMAEADAPAAEIVYTPLAQSIRNHPSNAGIPTAS